MANKTCGECIFYHGIYDDCGVCTLSETDETFDKTCDFVYSCKDFQPKQPITNGDVIRQMSNGVLAFLMTRLMVDGCPIGKNKPFDGCKISNDCTNCLKAWLNAPAESEGESE